MAKVKAKALIELWQESWDIRIDMAEPGAWEGLEMLIAGALDEERRAHDERIKGLEEQVRDLNTLILGLQERDGGDPY